MSYLFDGVSDGSDDDQGYDSEAAELSRGATLARTAKRRKLSHSSNGDAVSGESQPSLRPANGADDEKDSAVDDDHPESQQTTSSTPLAKKDATARKPMMKSKTPRKAKEAKPGVIYLSSLPPYLRPSALRNLLSQRGFEPITRLFLTPASKASSTSKKNSRQLYTEGWVEFASKKVARRCAEALNATPVGGKKGGFYRDDILNIKYLRGMGWDELMAGVREERREEEGRRDEERRVIVGEAKRFVEGVERSKREEGMKKKKRLKEPGADGEGQEQGVKRTWRQFEVQGAERQESGKSKKRKEDSVDQDVQALLGQIF